MDADFSVELGPEDETLEMPWAGSEDGPKHYDLKQHPNLLELIEEARRVPELKQFLRAMNSPGVPVETAKCDVWSSSEMTPEEEIFGAAQKFCSYIDILFTKDSARFSLREHEQFARRLTELLTKAADLPASAEFLIRRCYYHGDLGTRDGCYVTFYLFGYADDELQARQRWVIALELIEYAIKQALSEQFG